jgi:hypothetical protein
VTLQLADLKWKKSERMTDNPDGGGRMTAQVIVDGQVGNVFPNISRVNRAGGAVHMRKINAHVDSNNTDVAVTPGAIIVRPPADPTVSLVMFELTGDGADFAERADARDYVESYVVKGPVSPLRLYDTQQAGQRTILCWMEPTQRSPEVGEVYCLSVEASGWPTHEQFVRINDVSFVDQEFLYPNIGSKTWRIYTLQLNKVLDQAYPGEDPQGSINPQLASARTKVRRTQVAAAARYYGISALAEPAVPGDQTIVVDSIYNRLVPASTDPVGVINQLPGGVRGVQIAAGPAISLTVDTGSLSANPKAIYLGNSILPGSLTVTATSESGVEYSDAGGALTSETPTARCIGSPVNYADAVITLNANAYGGNYTFTWVPAATVLQSPQSQLLEITLGNQNTVYVFNMRPYPAAGSVALSYQVLGRWYTLYDDGAGHLVPEIPDTGVGVVDYQSGNASVTLGALPDVGSAIILSWGETEVYEALVGEITVDLPLITFEAPGDVAIDPASVSIAWTNGTAKTATGSATGAISGDATGRVLGGAGRIEFRPASLPTSGTIYTITYDAGEITDGSATSGTASGNDINDTLPTEPLPGSVRIVLTRTLGDLPVGWTSTTGTSPPVPAPLTVVDDGSGNLLLEGHSTVVGSINYATREWNVSDPFLFLVRVMRPSGGGHEYSITSVPAVIGDTYTYRYVLAATALTNEEETLIQGAIELSLLAASPVYRNPLPRGIRFRFNSSLYVDRGDGRLYRDLNYLNGTAVDAGSVNYSTGVALLEDYAAGSPSLTLQGLAVSQGAQWGTAIAFRTSGAPIAVESLQLTATTIDGTEINATAEADGDLIDDELLGSVDVEMGVVMCEFGHLDGETWVPVSVDLSSIRYNAVIQRYVPLDVDRLKLDPTRLPVDGRVPIYLPSQLVVIHNTQETTLAAAVAGATVSLPRAPINKLKLVDDNDQTVPEALYTADLELGQITYADPLDLTGYVEPLTAVHRIELTRQVNEVQINGLLKLALPLTANFPAESTYVSTMVEFDDLGARYEYLFSQKTWTNVWSNSRIGDDSIGKYDDVAYPPIVNNGHTISERLAIVFTGSTTYQVISEYRGVVATGSTSANCSVINPFTGQPSITILSAGMSGGWVANNVVRLNAIGAYVPVWLLRAIALSDSTIEIDQGAIEFRSDRDPE